MVVVDCVRDVDPRGMAYLGNVPVVRMEPDRTDRIATVAGWLLDEVFRTWLWLCRGGEPFDGFAGGRVYRTATRTDSLGGVTSS